MTTTTTKEFDLVSGEIVFWSSTMTSNDALENVQGFAPVKWGTINKEDALKMALKDHFGSSVLIRRNEKLDAFVVVDETTTTDSNEYESSAIYKVSSDEYDSIWTVSELRQPNHCDAPGYLAEIDATTNRYRNQVSAGRFSNQLGHILERQFNAVRVRNRGGAFFIPAAALERFNTFVESLEKETGNVVYRVKCGTDPNTTRAIIENARATLTEDYKAVKDELMQHDLNNTGDNFGSKRTANKRSRLMKQLESVQATADAIQAAFDGSQNILEEVNEDVEALEALAILQYLK